MPLLLASAVPTRGVASGDMHQLAYAQVEAVHRQVFSAPPRSRQSLTLPHAADVDFRASCFCHKRLIDLGFVCSVRAPNRLSSQPSLSGSAPCATRPKRTAVCGS